MALLLDVTLPMQHVTIDSKAFAGLPLPTLKSNITVDTNNNATMTIHTTSSIQGNNLNETKIWFTVSI